MKRFFYYLKLFFFLLLFIALVWSLMTILVPCILLAFTLMSFYAFFTEELSEQQIKKIHWQSIGTGLLTVIYEFSEIFGFDLNPHK